MIDQTFPHRLERTVLDIGLPENFSVKIGRDKIDLGSGSFVHGRFYFQIACYRMDVITKEMGWGYGGKAYLSEHMTDLELVNCIFGLYKGYIEHEARETFLYQGYRIYGPHNALPGLVDAAKRVDVRSAHHVEDIPDDDLALDEMNEPFVDPMPVIRVNMYGMGTARYATKEDVFANGGTYFKDAPRTREQYEAENQK